MVFLTAPAMVAARQVSQTSPFIDVDPADPQFEAIYARWHVGMITGYEPRGARWPKSCGTPGLVPGD